mmetsp:Transcript_12597/g.33827  ORF Transcript_12597/g.33827 Transcript_12597/m.33827 type:complete len:200 (+) Transcript_12597:371-970(+)
MSLGARSAGPPMHCGTSCVSSSSSCKGICLLGTVAPQLWHFQASASSMSSRSEQSAAQPVSQPSGYCGMQNPVRQRGQVICRARSGWLHRSHRQMNQRDASLCRRSMVLAIKFMPQPMYENVSNSPGSIARMAWYCKAPLAPKDHRQFGEQLWVNFDPSTKMPVNMECPMSSSSLWMFKSTTCRKRITCSTSQFVDRRG